MWSIARNAGSVSPQHSQRPPYSEITRARNRCAQDTDTSVRSGSGCLCGQWSVKRLGFVARVTQQLNYRARKTLTFEHLVEPRAHGFALCPSDGTIACDMVEGQEFRLAFSTTNAGVTISDQDLFAKLVVIAVVNGTSPLWIDFQPLCNTSVHLCSVHGIYAHQPVEASLRQVNLLGRCLESIGTSGETYAFVTLCETIAPDTLRFGRNG